MNESYEIAGEFITTVYKNTDILKINSNFDKIMNEDLSTFEDYDIAVKDNTKTIKPVTTIMENNKKIINFEKNKE